MKIAYHTWHENEVIGLHNWIYNIDKNKDAEKIEKIRNTVNRMKLRKILNSEVSIFYG